MKSETRDNLVAITTALIVGAFFVWHGEWAARGQPTNTACENKGYLYGVVSPTLAPYCASYGAGGTILTPLKDERPGEVDG